MKIEDVSKNKHSKCFNYGKFQDIVRFKYCTLQNLVKRKEYFQYNNEC